MYILFFNNDNNIFIVIIIWSMDQLSPRAPSRPLRPLPVQLRAHCGRGFTRILYPRKRATSAYVKHYNIKHTSYITRPAATASATDRFRPNR